MKQLGALLRYSSWMAYWPTQGTHATRSITTLLLLDGILTNTGYPAWSNWEHYYATPPGWHTGQHRVPSMKKLGALLRYSSWMAYWPTQGTQHEATRSITTLLLLDGILVQHRVPSMKKLGTLLRYSSWMAYWPTQDTQHEETRSITTLLLLDGLLANTGYPAWSN